MKKLYSSRGLYCTGGRDYFLILYSDLLFMVAPYMEKVELVNIERQCIKNARCRFYVPQPTFLFPLETPLQQSRNMLHGWKDNSMLPKTPCSMYPSVFNSFPVIRTASAKKSPFLRTTAHIFVSPGDAPATMTQNVAWMERQFNACQTPCSMYLSVFNRCRVIRYLSQYVSPKIAIFTTFLFPLGTPLAQSR